MLAQLWSRPRLPRGWLILHPRALLRLTWARPTACGRTCTPERGRANSRNTPQVVTIASPIIATEEAAKKRRASSLTTPTTTTFNSGKPSRPLPRDPLAMRQQEAGQSPSSLPVPEEEPGPRRRAASHAEPRAGTAETTANLLGMVSKLQQQLTESAKRMILFEADILKRLDENKEFAAKSTRALVDESCRSVVAGIEAEFSMSDRLKAHLIGRNEPVFETLFNQFHDPKLQD